MYSDSAVEMTTTPKEEGSIMRSDSFADIFARNDGTPNSGIRMSNMESEVQRITEVCNEESSGRNTRVDLVIEEEQKERNGHGQTDVMHQLNGTVEDSPLTQRWNSGVMNADSIKGVSEED